VADGEHRTFGQNDQVFVGDDGGDFEDRIVVRIQTGHFQVDPDEIVFVDLAHAPSWRAV
jgi:hypothetical protein